MSSKSIKYTFIVIGFTVFFLQCEHSSPSSEPIPEKHSNRDGTIVQPEARAEKVDENNDLKEKAPNPDESPRCSGDYVKLTKFIPSAIYRNKAYTITAKGSQFTTCTFMRGESFKGVKVTFIDSTTVQFNLKLDKNWHNDLKIMLCNPGGRCSDYLTLKIIP